MANRTGAGAARRAAAALNSFSLSHVSHECPVPRASHSTALHYAGASPAGHWRASPALTGRSRARARPVRDRLPAAGLPLRPTGRRQIRAPGAGRRRTRRW